MITKFLIISLDAEPAIHTFLAYAAMSSFPEAIVIGLHSVEQFQHYLSDRDSQIPDLLLLDSDLPAPGGSLSLLTSLQAHTQLQSTRIIMLSNTVSMPDMIDFYQAGGTLYRQKPKTMPEWRELVYTLKTYAR